MTQSVTIRIFRGLSAAALGQVVLTLIRYLEIPIFVSAWGVDLYGQWLVVASVPSFIAMGDLGFNGAAERHMTVMIAQGRREEALVVYQSAAAVVGVVVALVCLASFLVFLSDPATFFRLDHRFAGTFNSVIVLLTASAALALMRCNVTSTFRSEGRYAFASTVDAVVNGAQAALCFGILFAGGGPLYVAATILLTQGAAHLILVLIARRNFSWFRLGYREARFYAIRDLMAPSVASILIPLAQALSYQAPRMIIGSLLGPVSVTIFVAHRQITRIVVMLLSLNHPILTEAAMAFGRGEFERFVALCVMGMQSMIWLCGGAMVCLVVCGPFVFAVWLGSSVPYDPMLLLLLAMASSFEAGWRVINGPSYILNQYLIAAVAYVLTNAALVPVAYLATRCWGLEATALVVLASELMVGLVVLRSSGKVLRLSSVNLAGKLLIPPLWFGQTMRHLLANSLKK